MGYFKAMFLMLAMIVLTGGSGIAPIATEPVNNCMMIPEVVNGRTIGGNILNTGYEPESCIASRAPAASRLNQDRPAG